MNRYHKGTDILNTITVENVDISTAVNVYVMVVTPHGEKVKQMALYSEVGFIDGDLSLSGDEITVKVHRAETLLLEYGKYYYQVLASFSDAGFEDAVRIDSASKCAFQVVRDIEDTVDGRDIEIDLPKYQGESCYLYVAYASDDIGSDFSLVPTDTLKYRAEIQSRVELVPPTEVDFSGAIWVKYLGEDGTGSGDATLQEDIESIGVGTVGGINEGDILLTGTTFTEFTKQLLQKVVPPTYINPTLSLSVSPSASQEIGSTTSFTLTPNFNQNDAGAVNSVVFKRAGVTIHTQSNLAPFVDTNRTVDYSSLLYSVEVSYDDGAVKDDNFGNPYPIGQILAGTIVGNRTVTGDYYNWYGAYGTSAPTQGSDIRTLNSTFNTSFTLNTGTTALFHTIAVPQYLDLISVIDQDALNANITVDYQLSGTITQVPDGGGTLVQYKVYTLEITVPYSTNHRHNVVVG